MGFEKGEFNKIINIPVKDRTNVQHHKLIKIYGSVREYLLSMGEFKENKCGCTRREHDELFTKQEQKVLEELEKE